MLPPSLSHHLFWCWCSQVYHSHRQLFDDLPVNGFSSHFKNPCWLYRDPRRGNAHGNRNLLSVAEEGEALMHTNDTWRDERSSDIGGNGGGSHRRLLASSLRSRLHRGGITERGERPPPPRPHEELPPPSRGGDELECLPFAYVLGMPKCGSSDLWERLSKHASVQRADRKEVRSLQCTLYLKE